MEGRVSLKEFLLWRTTRDFLSFPLLRTFFQFECALLHLPLQPFSYFFFFFFFFHYVSYVFVFVVVVYSFPSGYLDERPWNLRDLDARIKKRRQKNFEWLMTATCAGVASILLRVSSPGSSSLRVASSWSISSSLRVFFHRSIRRPTSLTENRLIRGDEENARSRMQISLSSFSLTNISVTVSQSSVELSRRINFI